MQKLLPILSFEFEGRATVVHEPNFDLTDWKADVEMNKRVPEIIESLETKIKSYLPPGLSVNAQIEFRSGSLTWIGILNVLSWTAGISGTIGLGEYLIRTLNFTVNRIIRETELADNVRIDDPVTETTQVDLPTEPVNEQSIETTQAQQPSDLGITATTSLANYETLIKRFTYLSMGNLALSLAILILVIIRLTSP